MKVEPGCKTLAQDVMLLLTLGISNGLTEKLWGAMANSGLSIQRRHIGGFMRPGSLTVLISTVALSKHGVDQFSQEVVVSAETSKIRLTAAFRDCTEN